LGSCVQIHGESYCECPEGTQWGPEDCGECPVINAAEVTNHEIDIEVVTFEGQFLVGGAAPPDSEYDDANLWLENPTTGDRVLLGNTHDQEFLVRVTPGIYDVIYAAENFGAVGAVMPRNSHVQVDRVALFTPTVDAQINIPVGRVSGAITLNGAAPPDAEYDDASILFRHRATGDEVLVGNTHFGQYDVNLVYGEYDVVYRVETPGPVTPRNDGAVLGEVVVSSDVVGHAVQITSVALQGQFTINDAPPPPSEYDDANIVLESATAGTIALGNTHEGSYDVQAIAGTYVLIYAHETGSAVPQNQRARLDDIEVGVGTPTQVDIPMVELSGVMTINGIAPPDSQFDDGVLRLEAVNSEDRVALGNTHDGSYQVRLIPGAYDVYYSQETSGGTVPDNKHARVSEIVVDQTGVLDFNVDAVPISGLITFAGGQPPASAYEDGRIYLRNTTTDDAVLLGNTHDGGYSAIVVPGEYAVFYVQEAGGNVPGNQNALLANVSVGGQMMSHDLDLPVVSLEGTFMVAGAAPPNMPSDGGQVYLRTQAGDSLLLGDTFAAGFTAKLVAGTYGVYYRSEASMSMPQNENGRLACMTVE
jgi:hypothetical protein